MPNPSQARRGEATKPAEARPALLVLAHRVPYPPDKGDRIRTYHLLRTLAPRADVHLACLADEPVSPGSVEALERLCGRVAILPIGPLSRWARAAGALAAGRTASEGAFSCPALRGVLDRWASRTRYRAALASASSLAPYLRLPTLRGLTAVVDLVDVDSQKWLEYAASERGPKSWLHRLEGRRLRRLEGSIPDWGSVTLVSESEARLYRTIRPGGSAFAVTNGVDLEYFRPPVLRREDERGCVFVGALDYRPNVEGIHWFCHEVWPAVRQARPDATLTLVGRKPSTEVRRLGGRPGVNLVGQVPDVRDDLAKAAVVIAPLRIARGVQNKVLEALAMGKAVVASPQALEGLAAEPGVHLEVADNPQEWVSAISSLLGDHPRRTQLGAAGREYVEESHHWETCLEPFLDLLGIADEVVG